VSAPYLRLDSGVKPGGVVTTYYDALLAKVIAWAPERSQAAKRLAAGLAGARLAGPATNRDLLVSVLRNPAYLDGCADTSLLDDYDLAGLIASVRLCQVCAAAAAMAVASANRREARTLSSVPGGWRNLPSQPQITSFSGPRGRIAVRYRWKRTGIVIEDGGADASLAEPAHTAAADEIAVAAFAPDAVTLDLAGVRHRFDITRVGMQLWVGSDLGSVLLTLLDRLPTPERVTESGSLIAPMPGSVTRIAAEVGDGVVAGQVVLVMEAMKMEHEIVAPASGVLAELRVAAGAQVNAGDVLATVTASEPTGGRG
jgi:propionyl-CoA carboxylase alpha chain